MSDSTGKHYLIVEGGGFKTGFTSGILDAFIAGGFDPFDGYMGVSGGSVAVSYYTAKQYRQTLESILYLAKDSNFVKYRRSLGQEGFMDIDTLGRVSTKIIPFDIKKALLHIRNKDFRIVATDRQEGNPVYFKPSAQKWIDHVIASCTLPFVTKGKHIIDGREYFDGGWSDALPVKYAADQGASRITVLRTWPVESVFNQSWPDYFGGIYFKGTPVLKEIFEKNYTIYNNSIEFINNPPQGITVDQLAPKKLLKSGTYSYSKKSIMNDYRYGLDVGLRYIAQFK